MGSGTRNRLLPAIFAGALLLVGAIGNALLGTKTEERPGDDNPYLNTLEGVMTRHGKAVTRDMLLAARETEPGVEAGSEAGSARPRVRPPESLARSELGKMFVQLMGDPDVIVQALTHAQGSFIYSRKGGWMKLIGGEWVSVHRASLPRDLRERYPSALYPDLESPERLGTGHFDSGRGGSGNAVARERPANGPQRGAPVSEEDATVALVPAPALDRAVR